MHLTLAAKLMSSRVALAAALALIALPAAAQMAGEDSQLYPATGYERPHQMRGAENSDVPTSNIPYDGPAFIPEPQMARDESTPPDLTKMLNTRIPTGNPEKLAARKIRMEALKESGRSFGARGGLARRTWEIRQQLAKFENDLDRTYNFRALLIAAPSGLLIEPPIVGEAEQNVIVSGDGQQAAVSDQILKINREAQIVTAAREWRTYLERDWGKVEPPPAVLLPRDNAERTAWAKWVAEGWEAGYKQADEIYQADLDRIVRDYTGMVRYRWLLAQNMISPPYALQEDRGVTGGGSELRIGDRAVSITGQSRLSARPENWQTIPRDR